MTNYKPNLVGMQELLEAGILEGNITKEAFRAFFEKNQYQAFNKRPKKVKPQKTEATQSKKQIKTKSEIKISALTKILNSLSKEMIPKIIVKDDWSKTFENLAKNEEILSARYFGKFVDANGKTNADSVKEFFERISLTTDEVNSTRQFFPKIQVAKSY